MQYLKKSKSTQKILDGQNFKIKKQYKVPLYIYIRLTLSSAQPWLHTSSDFSALMSVDKVLLRVKFSVSKIDDDNPCFPGYQEVQIS